MQPSRDLSSLYGAVDLGALQAAAQRRERAAKAAASGDQAGAPSGNVIDVTDETFNADVVDRSRSVPVILDLWAEWCGPCKQLSPVLEKLADEADGAWVLAKVDVDANPQLSAALQVQSIPMVVAVVAGQVVDGFLGALPEANVVEWLGQIMQIAQRLGLPGQDPVTGGADGQAGGAQVQAGPGAPPRPGPGGPAGPGGPPGPGPGGRGGPRPGPMGPGGPGDMFGDPGFAEAQQAMERGDLDGAAAAFEKVLGAQPGHPAATMGLAQVDLIRRVNSYDQAKTLRDAEDNPDDPEAQGRAADIEVATGRIDVGFSRLLDAVRRTSGEERNQARLRLIGLFEAFPPGDPRVAKARATLSSLLF
jgi:putative thioredoxin